MTSPAQRNADVATKPVIRVVPVGLDSPHLPKVMALHAARKSRLGQFPAGAFEDHARRKLILAAVTPEDVLAGYLLYRIAVSKSRAAIVHLTTVSVRGQNHPVVRGSKSPTL